MELISDGSISNHITKKIYQFSFEFFLPKLFPNNSNDVEPIPWKDESQKVVDINYLVETIKNKLKQKDQRQESNPFTSAQFALQMIQGAEKVRFISS